MPESERYANGNWCVSFCAALGEVLEGERRSGSISDFELSHRGETCIVKFHLNHVVSHASGWFGYQIDTVALRAAFEPADPLGVADAWFYNIFPPGRLPDPTSQLRGCRESFRATKSVL